MALLKLPKNWMLCWKSSCGSVATAYATKSGRQPSPGICLNFFLWSTDSNCGSSHGAQLTSWGVLKELNSKVVALQNTFTIYIYIYTHNISNHPMSGVTYSSHTKPYQAIPEHRLAISSISRCTRVAPSSQVGDATYDIFGFHGSMEGWLSQSYSHLPSACSWDPDPDDFPAMKHRGPYINTWKNRREKTRGWKSDISIYIISIYIYLSTYIYIYIYLYIYKYIYIYIYIYIYLSIYI